MSRHFRDRGKTFRDEWAEDGTTLLFEAALENAVEEVAAALALGLVRPFVEGEVIGSCLTPIHTYAAWIKDTLPLNQKGGS